MTVDLESRFLAYLTHHAVGQAQAKTAVTVCAALGLAPSEASRRVLRGLAHDAAAAGHLICSGQTGYYVPASPEEVRACTSPLLAQAGEMWTRAKRMEQLAAERFELREMPEPETPSAPLLVLMEAAS